VPVEAAPLCQEADDGLGIRAAVGRVIPCGSFEKIGVATADPGQFLPIWVCHGVRAPSLYCSHGPGEVSARFALTSPGLPHGRVVP
jgi:hypothetical protein